MLKQITRVYRHKAKNKAKFCSRAECTNERILLRKIDKIVNSLAIKYKNGQGYLRLLRLLTGDYLRHRPHGNAAAAAGSADIVEGLLLGHTVPLHQDALCLFNQLPILQRLPGSGHLLPQCFQLFAAGGCHL